MSLFKSDTFHIGDVKDGDIAKFRFDISEDNELNIEYINWGCTCTTGTKVVDGKYIEGELDITKAGFINGNSIHKAITVNFNDGHSEYIADPDSKTKKSKINPIKSRQVLFLKGVRSDVD